MKFPLALLFFAGAAVAMFGQSADLTSPNLWKPGNVPFSFVYGDRQSAQFLPTWQASNQPVTADVHRYDYTDPATHLKVTAEVRVFPDFPDTVDWVIRFRNDGTGDTPIIENILPLDWSTPVAPGDCAIRHDKGSDANADDFKPLEEHLAPGGKDHFESSNGRSSDGASLPFFNLQTGDHGIIGAIGWTGNWKADFACAQDGRSVSLSTGMKQTHLLLHPGEEIRTPRIVLMKWSGGSWQNSQNGWRRLILAHYTPHDNGAPMIGPIVAGGDPHAKIDANIALVNWLHDNHIPVNIFNIGAGWFGTEAENKDDYDNAWWKNRGDWFPNPGVSPDGLKPLGDACKAAGIGFSLWVEPETCMPGRKIITDHPDWYLHSDHPVNPGVELTNYSNPAALRGIDTMLSGFITGFGVTLYSQDFNIPPEEYWSLNDKPDRIGMTEIGHIEGLYKLWDDLRAKHPGLHIENCASGGRRIDIETMSRSYILWRSDYGCSDTLADQAFSTALAPWIPGTCCVANYTTTRPWAGPGPFTTPEHLYLMRLSYQAAYALVPGEASLHNAAWVTWLKQALREYQEVQPYFYGDFYTLQPYSRDASAWTAWQWDRPGKKDGLVIVLRRPKSLSPTMELGLQHLNPDATYKVEIRSAYDTAPIKEMRGSDLAGLQVSLPNAPGSTLVFYKEAPQPSANP